MGCIGEEKMMKKIFRKAFILVPALLLTACNFKFVYNIEGLPAGGLDFDDDIEDSGTYDIKVWVDDRIVDLTKSQIGQFVTASGGKYTINATVEPVSESGAASQMLLDVQDGADLFVFAQDQLSRLKVAGSLAKLNSTYVDALTEDMGIEAVNAAKVNQDVYAFPITSDNGYFLYYDKNVVSDEAAKNMTTLLAACSAQGKTLNFEAPSNGFYAASYFMATGCYSEWTLDDVSGKFVDFKDNYNSDAGLIAGRAMMELNTSTVAKNSQASKLGDTAAAVVSGIWEYEVAQNRAEKNGFELGCAPLPSFTVDGKDYHLSSFDGYKLLGVKPQVDAKKASVCRKLARFLTGEDCQTERFSEASWGPTNIASNQSEKVLAHKGLQALHEQHKYAKAQGQCPGAWFNALATAATAIVKAGSPAAVQDALNTYNASLTDLLDAD